MTSLLLNGIVNMYCFLRNKSISGWVFSKPLGQILSSSPSKFPQTFLNESALIIYIKVSDENSNSLRMRNKSLGLGSQNPQAKNELLALMWT